MLKPLFARLLMLVCCGALVMGCATKARQCRQAIDLAGAANAQATRLATPEADPSGVADTKSLLQAAETLAAAGEELRTLQLGDAQLQSWQSEYAATYDELAAATRDLVAAIDRRDREAAELARERLETASASEATLVQTINDYCLSDET